MTTERDGPSSGADRRPSLECSHKQCLIDEPIQLMASGLEEFGAYTLTAHLTDENGYRFGGFAHFVADRTGVFSTMHSPSLNGSYLGRRPMGLITHMRPLNGQRTGLRLMKRDVSKPFKTHVALHLGHLEFSDLGHFERTPICSLVVERTYLAADVRRIPVRQGRFRGTLFLPPGKGPFPTIIDLFGTAGGLIEYRSALLASRGIASLALAYFDYDDLPERLIELELEYFLEASLLIATGRNAEPILEWLAKQPTTMSGRIGVVGVSYGAEIAVLMGIESPYVVAVVPIGSPIGVVDFPITLKYKTIECAYSDIFRDTQYIQGKGWAFHGDNMLMTDEVLFKLEQAAPDTEFLFVCGQEDPFANYKEIAPLLRRSRRVGASNFDILWYAGSGHLIEPPFSPHCDSSWHKLFKDCMYWGGQADFHADAQSDAWVRVQRFFRQRLAVGCSKL